jgi:tetratricopeptide (TPR) repeat protein
MFPMRISLLLCLSLPVAAQNAAVTVREDKLTLATYNEGAPDPNPQFDAFYQNVFPNYPYPMRTPVNQIRTLTPWRVLIIENEYLSCRILPDLGGHLHGCTDRITGKEIFYANPAIRRTGDSVRGTYIATGIESNFPFAHTRVASSPVDFASSVVDGVGRIIVEDTDRTLGVTWRDEFILRPGSAVLEQRVTLYNGSPARRGYHWWANAAIELDDPHLRIIYPTRWMLPHDVGAMTPWPVSESGMDMTDVANYKGQAGLFAHGSHEPWMAIYKPRLRSGLAHYADPNLVKGKKIWVFGKGALYPQQSLTENFNSYVEMQAGEFETQPEFAFLLPGETKAFSHYWIPFRDLGGVSRATPDAVLNLSRTGTSVLIEIEATHAIKGAELRLADGGKQLSETPLDLDPKVKFAKTVEAAKLTVDLINANGMVALHHVEGEYDAIPFDKNAKNLWPVAPDNSDSEATSLARGEFNEQRDQWNFAWHDYQAGLKKSPGSMKLAVAAGRAAVALNRYADAIRLLKDPANGGAEAAYYYGVALGSTSQHVAEAKAALNSAANDPAYTVAAKMQLAMLEARESGAPGAAEATRILQALGATAGAPAQIGALEVAVLRRAGKVEESKNRLRFWLQQDPANDMLRVEQSFSGKDDPTLWDHLAADPERVLNVADQYRQIGACDDALKILDRQYSARPATETEPGAVLPQDYPLVVYYRGYCRSKVGDDSKPDFSAASKLSILYVFPHREIYFRVFAAAIAQDSADPVAHALLGDLYFDSLQTPEAISEWRQALALKRDLPALHRNLGRALLEIANDPTAAAPVLMEGSKLEPDNADIARALSQLKLAPAAPGDAANRALVRSVSDAAGATAVFTFANFPKDKQSDAVRRAYIEVQLQLLLAGARGGNCPAAMAGVETFGDVNNSLPFTQSSFGSFIKQPHVQYYLGAVESACGNEKAAKKRWTKVSKSNEPAGSLDYVFPYLAAKKLADGDSGPRIEGALQELSKAPADDSHPALVFSQGALLVTSGKKNEGDALLQKAARAGDSLVQYMSLLFLAEASRK